ncbi:hypothetical protein NL108_006153 [Boleophthalmus pectinirostris]|uniref:suppressor of cytokine signaling 1-like n=1 Tax=Boleophthalmus pectinirostris TaxID=150288 RepID=UPI000A1C21B0|nr:suppressor of cytokine signaling 1-like [Boleophthalmus pectinirostris]KAJ0050798.1 hypothetical protein NL108_006153 [Boleophthalmus pectinirostris]
MSRSGEEEGAPWRVRRTTSDRSRMLTADLTGRQKPNTGTQRGEAGTILQRENTAEERVSVQLPNIQLELHKWNVEPESAEELNWKQALCAADGAPLPTHLRPFCSPEQYTLVKQTYQQLQHSGYYWGALSMEEAHAMLSDATQGTFLIRDSVQPDVFFTLSYCGDDGPTSVRVLLNKNLQFSLHGSHKTFPSLFALLTHYTGPTCKLSKPLRTERPERLSHMCRRAIVRAFGAHNITTVSGLSTKDVQTIYLYPYSI